MGEDQVFTGTLLYKGNVIGPITSLKISVRREEEKMKIVEVKFFDRANAGQLSKGFVFNCANDLHAKLSVGSKVVVDTRYGVTTAVVTNLNVRNPEVTPYKFVISLIDEKDLQTARSQEEYVQQYWKEKGKKARLEDLTLKMTRFLGEFTAQEVCAAIAGCNPVMNRMWKESLQLDNDSSEYRIRESMAKRTL